MSAGRPVDQAFSPDPAQPSVSSTPTASTTSKEEHPRIGELVATLSTQFSTLVKGEIALTKTKAIGFVKKVGAGAGFLVVAAILALYLIGWIFHTIEVALTYAVPLWAAALITVGILILLILILVLMGISAIKKGQRETPEPQVGVKKDIDAVKKGLDK